MSKIIRLFEDEVLSVRRRMAELTIAEKGAFGQVEPIDRGKFSSAVHRQFTSGGGVYKYNTVHDVGANLFYGVAMAHSFENGNKRTALVSLLVMLDKNRHLLVNTEEDELYEMARQVAAHEIEVPNNLSRNADSECKAVASWIRARTRNRVLGEQALDFQSLRALLEEQGCEFEKPDRNFIKIKRDKWVVKTGYPKHNFDVAVPELKRIRKALRLDEAHGTDSAAFYDLEDRVESFVNQHRNLLRRLADL